MCFYVYEIILDCLFGKKPINYDEDRNANYEENIPKPEEDYLDEEERKLIAEKRLKAESLRPSEAVRMITERRKREEALEKKIEKLSQRFDCLNEH